MNLSHLDGSASETQPVVSIIVPARNEEANLRRCLDSLLAQDGIAFEIIVVNDHSDDRTRAIALEYRMFKVLDARPVLPGWTGKANAVVTALPHASGQWLLFTDADTFHLPGSLKLALREAESGKVDMLSYSPSQDVHGVIKRGVMAVIFAELASQYPSSLVNDPNASVAAANGQYLLIRRSAYDAVGGHAKVAASLLEDVELAKLLKSAGYLIRFRFGGEAVHTEMYRTWPALIEGWTKNLALLFPHPVALAAFRVTEFAAILWFAGHFFIKVRASGAEAGLWDGVAVSFLVASFVYRIQRSHSAGSNIAAFLGLPVFAALLLHSYFHLGVKRSVQWKGRTYLSSWPK